MTVIDLYPFQQEDLDKLSQVEGALNASEMGTGKTYVGAALAMERAPKRSKLWVGPLQTLEGSAEKILQMYPDVPIVTIDRKNRDWSYEQFKKGNPGFFMLHWESLRLMPDIAEEFWGYVVGDEIQKAQNRKSQQTRALKKIKAAGRLGMSGTPVTGAPHKYWSGLNWLYPKSYRSYWNFYKEHTVYELVNNQFHKITGVKNVDVLLSQVNPFYTRHLKKEQCCPHHPQGVMPWLPDKYYEVMWVDLHREQRQAYDEMRKEMIAWVGQNQDQPLVAPVAIAQLTRLQQFSSAFATVDISTGHVELAEPSSKIDALIGILEDTDHQVVVWSHFTRLLKLVAKRLDKEGISYVMFTGDNANTREAEKAKFIRGDVQVFLGNMRAGGVGVDGLQEAASLAVMMDEDWDPSINKQAEDRLWRDGQQNSVQVIQMRARDTVDVGVNQKVAMKWEWIRQLLGDV